MSKKDKKESAEDKEKAKELKEQEETVGLMDAEVEAATICGPDDDKDKK
ncbi:MAG: hypothetical protein LUC43_05175 [Burkholderiales bacterium]|nr:hypothetical protein [Burkholderiales bacterium]